MNVQQTIEKMKELRLHGMLLDYRSSIESQGHLQLTPDELLTILVDAEWQDRSNKKVTRLTQAAAFRYQSNLSDIDYQASRELDRDLLTRLSCCQFIQQKENILIVGPTGVGKSYVASALGHQACAMGYRVAYYNTAKLFARLHSARADNSLFKEIARIEKQDLLILDDFGLQSLDKPQRDLLMEIIEDRHNKKSTIIASQLPVSAWHEVIGEGTVADAILDRLVHGAQRLSLSGESMRKVKK
ncbi:IS21-like element helper ATPase IstB [Sphingobacterium multivorum]|uniref:IS21-like element helper ATPase IstB n=1 Tax=Sphingobacterium multivorum TaxID=28454 RepID=A0ABX7CH80_SPHMU|nr:IS21-like element helper ATPase IstB [Sphingobacterium multivorum]QQT51462.1 IS21-like element helper ATPase IstB [Sphingobacterium multivorum]